MSPKVREAATLGLNGTSATFVFVFVFTLNLMRAILFTKRELQDGQMCENIHRVPRTRQSPGPWREMVCNFDSEAVLLLFQDPPYKRSL